MIKRKKSKFEGMLKWKKIRGGVHNHRDGQVVRKGEYLYANELSPLIAEGFECLNPPANSTLNGGISLGIKSRGNGWYDVINKVTGETLNDEAMRAKDAKQFITGEEEEEEEDTEDDEKVVNEDGSDPLGTDTTE